MKVAIVGGGASGLITAHLLDGAHDVTVFEEQPVLGGHVRTLGKNCDRGRVDPDLVLDNGVIEFEETSFVHFHRLIASLGVPTETVHGATSLFLADGRRFLSPGAVRNEGGRWRRLVLRARLAGLAPAALRFWRTADRIAGDEEALRRSPMSTCLGRGVLARWFRMLLMYAYSTPYAETADFPALVGLPVLAHMSRAGRWTRIVGGVYTYIERLLDRFRGTIHRGAAVQSIRRPAAGVRLTMADGTEMPFDRLVFAAPPDRFLPLLLDPTDDERRRFGAWRGRTIRTFIHSDLSIYRPSGARYFSEFDLFELTGRAGAGYNAWLNRLAGIDPARPHMMAYNLESIVDPQAVLQVVEHATPRYEVEATRHRSEVLATSGENGTLHAGAWLGDGLHEGATVSALAVSERLGGKRLDG